MDVHSLTEIGLTDGESRVYISLLRLGTTKTGPLARNAKVSASKVYKILDRLEQKGLAGHIIHQKTKFFRAIEPKRILDYLDEKEQEIDNQKKLMREIIPKLQMERGVEGLQEEAAVYEGFKAIKNLYNNMLDLLGPGSTYYVIGATYNEEILGVKAFFEEYHNLRASKGVRVKMLANHNVKGGLVPSTLLKSEVRYLPSLLMTNLQVMFYGKTAVLVLWTKNPKGFLIKNEEAVKGFKTYFEAFWKTAK